MTPDRFHRDRHLARVELGDESVAALYTEFNDALVRYLTVRLPSIEDAREVAQEAYLRVLSREPTHSVTHLQAYLFKTASNLAIDRVRASQRRPTGSLDQEAYEVEAPGSVNEELVHAARQVEVLREIVGELPPKCRMAFLLYKFDDLSYPEIAARMELTESMIRKYVLRAMVYCRERLDALQGVTSER